MGRPKPYTGSTSKKAEDLFCTPAKQETAAPRWGISSFHDSLSQFVKANNLTQASLVGSDANDNVWLEALRGGKLLQISFRIATKEIAFVLGGVEVCKFKGA